MKLFARTPRRTPTEWWASVRAHPFAALLQILFILAAFVGFYCVVNFAVAEAPAQALARYGVAMPSDWEAGVMNHRQYIQWYLISRHPFAFAGAIGWLLGAVAATGYTGKLLDQTHNKTAA
jgi:hypothetical protein